ncbi:MAG: CPBP family intramembrane glutamic endopeptidase [Antricoccus sp.]
MLDHAVLPGALRDFGQSSLAAALIGAYLVFGEPFVGVALHRAFERAVAHDRKARRWLYSRILILEWVLAILCIVTILLAQHVTLEAIGLRWPRGITGWSITLGSLLIGLLVLALTQRGAIRLRSMAPGQAIKALGGQSVVAMLPRTAAERQWFGAVSVTAGICEEIAYRGFLLAVIAAIAPGFPVVVAAVVAVVGFGVAHAYQGPQGIVGTMVIGAVLAALYLTTWSLIAPMILHALIDLRAVPLGRILAPSTRSRHRR